MSKYRFVSAKEVLARVMRSTGSNLPSMYHDDILEWISEGLGMMQVTNTLIIASTGDEGCVGELKVSNHCVQLPCGFVSIIALEDCNGCRMMEQGNNIINHIGDTLGDSRRSRVSSFEVNPFNHQTSTGLPTNVAGVRPPYYTDGQDIKKVHSTNGAGSYKIVENHLQTSIECGFIKMHYYALPTGEDGYPLIPDNENFKQGLEWYVLKRLIGAGYEHKVFNYPYADEQCEKYMARGMGEVSFYTPEGAAKLNSSFIRLIPAPGYYEEFFGQ